jgi:hypothetical protein
VGKRLEGGSALPAAISEEEFVKRLIDWVVTEDEILRQLTKEAVKKLGKALAGASL